MDQRQDFLERLLPYRLHAIEILAAALRYRSQWTDPVPLQMYLDGKLRIEGLSTAFTNPAIESGIIHCRALLEFLGLGEAPDDHTRLAARRSRKRDTDLWIEDFSDENGVLRKVLPEQAVSLYSGPPDLAERALARMIHVANKGLAHSTVGLVEDPDDYRLGLVACEGIPALFEQYFFGPLGLDPPPRLITSRLRNQP